MVEEGNLPSNSHVSKEAPKNNPKERSKRAGKVVKGHVTTRKPKKAKKFLSNFFSEDITDVREYIVGDVIIPAIKDVIVDTVTNGINMVLYGEVRGRGRGKGWGNRDKPSYTRYFDSPYSHRGTRNKPASSRDPFDLDEIILDDYADADDALTEMCELIDQYGNASVADLYDILGLECPWTWGDYGWEALGRAEAVRLPDGSYILDLPKPKRIVKK